MSHSTKLSLSRYILRKHELNRQIRTVTLLAELNQKFRALLLSCDVCNRIVIFWYTGTLISLYLYYFSLFIYIYSCRTFSLEVDTDDFVMHTSNP
jgi:hypothetical protein